jgi:hypothetical protein
MSSRYETARGERNWLERLGEKIPGFAGFQDRELRRDTDKLEREHLSRNLTTIKADLRARARALADAGQLAALGPFDRLEKRLDGLSQTVRFADYGASGFFAPEKIDEADLARVYEFDLSLLEAVEALGEAVRALPGPGESLAPALEQLAARLEELERSWASRESVMTGSLGG